MSKQHEMVGKIFPTNNGGDCVIVNYINSTNVRVKFLDDYGHEVHTSMKSIRIGNVRNPFAKSVHGVGYLGFGKYRTTENGVHTKAYLTWSRMLRRCYSEVFLLKNPTYRGCKVCEDWHNLQDFSSWFYLQEFSGAGYELDKDILSKSGKIYSPRNCSFVPKEINGLFNKSEASRTNMPQGVSFNKKTKGYTAQLSVGTGKRKSFGTYKTAELAYQTYKSEKEFYVKEVARKWRGKIDENVFDALMNWNLD